jgi:hypothetical protein
VFGPVNYCVNRKFQTKLRPADVSTCPGCMTVMSSGRMREPRGHRLMVFFGSLHRTTSEAVSTVPILLPFSGRTVTCCFPHERGRFLRRCHAVEAGMLDQMEFL